jgi:hypothetical protein
MHVLAQAAAQGAGSAKVVVVFAAITIVAFWRALLRLLIALIVIGLVVLVGAGAIVVLQR